MYESGECDGLETRGGSLSFVYPSQYHLLFYSQLRHHQMLLQG